MADLALGIAGLAIGIPGLVQVIGQLGDAVLQRSQRYDDEYQKQLELVIQISKSQMQDIFLYLDRENRRVPEALKDEIASMFQTLRNTFERLLTVFSDIGPGNQISKPLKMSASMKEKAETEVRAIENWNSRILNRTLVFKLFCEQPTPGMPPRPLTPPATDSVSGYGALASKKVERLRDSIDKSLDQAKNESQVLLNPPDEPDDCHSLPNSSLELRTPKAKGGKPFIVEYRTYSSDALDREVKNHRQIVREVARIMRQADPEFMGLLYCDGFLWDSIKCRFELHFPIPSGLRDPRTLLELLYDPTNGKPVVKHPLNQRIGLAKRIVTAVFVLHAANFVHKQIRPDNILVFEHELPIPPSSTNSTRGNLPDKRGYPYVLGKPFLIGFDNVRKVDAASLMLPTEDWKKSIYLSPERHRLQRGDDFRMEHDIYSLGVVLLEIAFWSSFQDKRSPQLGKLIWKDKSQSTMRPPQELKKTYMSLATGAVPRLMGQKYADVVMACLTSLDLEEGDVKSLEDMDGIVIGTRYITEVIKKLEEISM